MKPQPAPPFLSPRGLGATLPATTPRTARPSSRTGRLGRTPRNNAGSTSASAAAAAAAAPKAVFTSSPVPFFTLTAPSLLPSLSGQSSTAASRSVYATPQSEYRPLYGRTAESIAMRRLDDQPAVWKGDDSDEEEEAVSVASLKAINQRNKRQLRKQREQQASMDEKKRQHESSLQRLDEASDARAAVPVVMREDEEVGIVSRLPAQHSRASSRAAASVREEQTPSATGNAAAGRSVRRTRPTSSSRSQQHRSDWASSANRGQQPSAEEQRGEEMHTSDAVNRPPSGAQSRTMQAQQHARRQMQAAVSDDEEDEDEDGSEGGSGDEDSDEDEERDNSDADYVDAAIDDNARFADSPSPVATAQSKQPQHFAFNARPVSSSVGATANEPPTPSASSSPLTIEMVASVVHNVFSPPSLLSQLASGPQLSPTPSSAAANLLGSPAAESSASSLTPPMYPALPELSRASALLLGFGLTVSASQHLMALVLLYAVCWHDVVSVLRRDMSDSEPRERKDAVLARLWRLFHLALTSADAYEPTAEEAEMGETREDRRLLPEMRVTVEERRRRQRKAEMADKRSERLLALRERESHAADRVLHYHRQLLALSAEKVKVEEERKRMEAEVEAERTKQRQRNEEKARRLQMFEELKRRTRVAREKQRMLEEDRAGMERHMPAAQANSNQLHAQLKAQRADNEQLSAQLRQVTANMHDVQQQSATFQQREKDGKQQEADSRREEAEGKQREATERGKQGDLYERLVYDVAKRVRVVTEVSEWTAATLHNEAAASSLVGEVERTSEQRADMEEDIRQMRETHVEMQQSIVTERANEVRLTAEVASNTRRVVEEEDALLDLHAQLQAADATRAVQQAALNSIVARYNEAQAALLHDQTRISITIQHIETLNADSVAVDRHNYARMKEARQMDKAKAAMEMERGDKRSRVEQFEDNKKRMVWEREARNSERERECVEWMRRVKERQGAVAAVEVRERELVQLQRDKLDAHDKLTLEVAQSKDERVRLLEAVEEAKEAEVALREKQAKVAAIQQNEDSLLVSLQAAHDSQLATKRAEVEALQADAEAVQQQLTVVRGELSEAAVRRAAMEADNQAVMAGMQDKLTGVVREGAVHDDEMKAWMTQQREERDAVTKESEQWKKAGEEAVNEQARLRREVEAVRARVRQQKAEQEELRMQHAIATQNNNTATSAPQPPLATHTHAPVCSRPIAHAFQLTRGLLLLSCVRMCASPNPLSPPQYRAASSQHCTA